MLKIRYILMLTLCVLLPVAAMHAETVTSTAGHHDQDIKDGMVILKDAENRATFTLSGMDIKYKTRFGALNIDAYDLGTVGWKSSQFVTLSWTVDPDYSIVVTKISFWVRAYTSADWYEDDGKVVFNGKTKSAGSIWIYEWESEGATFSESKADGFQNNLQIECKNALTKLSAILYSYDYMMKNLEIEYTLIPKFIFKGNGAGGASEQLKWENEDNWFPNTLPTISDSVFIRHDVVITDEATAKTITIENPNTLTVAPTGQLTVGTGGVINATAENFTLQAGTSGADKGKTGTLLIDPSCTAAMPFVTAEMYSTAYFDMTADDRNNVGSYQYVGSPMVGGAAAKAVFTSSWCYNWDEATGAWKNNRKNLVLQPFVGYATSQFTNPDGLLISHTGQLASKADIVLPLTYNGSGAEGGANVLANSYTAPIDITKMQTSDFVNAEATIYLFNTGSKNDVATASSNTDPGQYVAIPINLAGTGDIPAVIPPMQGFYVQASTPGVNGTLTLNYKRMVWNAANGNTALRAPQQTDETDMNSLCVSLSADGWSDRLYLIESDENKPAFENGYDAHKMMSGNLNIFSIEGTDSLAVDATNSFIGTRIGVRTGDETTYMLRFSHLNSEQELALLDEETSEMVDIDEGTEYTFFAEPNSILSNRFRIIARSKAITTDLDKAEGETKAHKFIKGNQLYILKNGVLYNVMGTIVQK